MLGYQREIIAQAQRTAAGLWVVAPGLGLSSIIQQLVYCEERAEKRRGKNRVIIILNGKVPYKKWLRFFFHSLFHFTLTSPSSFDHFVHLYYLTS